MSKLEGYSGFLTSIHFEQIPIKSLVSNQEYQRRISLRHIQRMVANFDPRQINPVKVSRRDGLNYVVNGQHTIETIAAVSGSRETPVWCMVFDDLSYDAEADLFAKQQKYHKPLSSYEIFAANIEAANDEQLIIKSLVESYGLRVSPARVLSGICAVSCLEQIYRRYGYHTLDRVLRLIVAAWEGEPISMSASILKGMALLVDTYGDDLKDDLFQERLSNTTANEIIRTGKSRRPGTMGYAEALVIAYNRGKKFCVPMRMLETAHSQSGETPGIPKTSS